MKLHEVFTASRIAFYGLLLVAGLTVAVHVKLWLGGLGAGPAITLYRTRTVYREMPRDKKAGRGLEETTVTRQVKVLVPAGDRSRRTVSGAVPEIPSVEETSNTSSIRTPRTEGSTASSVAPGLPPGWDLLGTFRVEPLPEGGSARVTLDESGSTHLEVRAQPAGLLELGRLRELGIWYGVRLDDRSARAWDVSYQQDILRLGPGWLRGRVEYGDAGLGFGARGKIQLGAAFRF